MATDVKLDQGADENTVLIESARLKATAADFLLDSPARRGTTHTRRPRRALVHDQTDGLTINFNSDYPGGVTINDVVALNSRRGISLKSVVELAGVTTVLQPRGAGGGGGGDGKPQMLIRGQIFLEAATAPQVAAFTESAAGRRGRQQDKTTSLQSILETLATEVVRLQKRVAELEKRTAYSSRK